MDTRISEIGTLSASDGQTLLHMWRVEVPPGGAPTAPASSSFL